MASKLVFTMRGLIVLNGKEIGTYRREYSKRTPHGGQRLIWVSMLFHGDEMTYGAEGMREARMIVLGRPGVDDPGRLASPSIAA